MWKESHILRYHHKIGDFMLYHLSLHPHIDPSEFYSQAQSLAWTLDLADYAHVNHCLADPYFTYHINYTQQYITIAVPFRKRLTFNEVTS